MNSGLHARIQDSFDQQTGPGKEVVEASKPVGASPTTRIPENPIMEDFSLKEGLSEWQQSPTRTTLLPPFGLGNTSHLPTPLSPRNLDGYLTRPGESPLASDISRAGPSRHLDLHPPSRPSSVHPPKTPQNDVFASTSNFPSRSIPPPFRTDPMGKARFLDSPRPQSSQVPTPSPEISRARHVSIPNTPFDSKTMVATPGKGSSPPRNGNTTLAPAPIISPANSNHSTIYHTSSGTESDKNGRAGFKFSRSLADLVSGNRFQSTTEGQGTGDLADPFLSRDDAGRNVGTIRERYPSPPTSHNLQHCSTHGNGNSPVSRVYAARREKRGIAKLVMSPSESSETPSHTSLLKTELEDEDDIVVRIPRPLSLNSQMHSQVPTVPRTPPRAGSVRTPEAALCTPPLDQSAFRMPSRITGRDIERFRQPQVALVDTHTRVIESERPRPDYLVRAKRTRDNHDEDEAEGEQESAESGLGVTVTPIRGRRLKLYRPVPVPGISILDDVGRPEIGKMESKTPPLDISTSVSAPTISLRAINWSTPVQRQKSPVIWTEEDMIKKQKRLAAFVAREPSERRNLKPVEIPGQGRMVIDVTSAEIQELVEAGVVGTPPPDPLDDADSESANGLIAEWPDNEYPWSIQRLQRHEHEEAERQQRLHRIERFLDRESESEEEDLEGIAGPHAQNSLCDAGTPLRTQHGRGKTISLSARPGSRCTTAADQRVFWAANADAREVLLSKKHVRQVAERLRRRKAAEEDEGVVMCICQGADDGRPMVRCDECRTWYHLVCMDITDESELGDEWFCWKCVPSTVEPPLTFEPTFAPVMPDTPPRTSVGDLPLYQTALQPSPILDIHTRGSVTPSAPARHNRQSSPSSPRQSRLPHSISDPDDPVRGGPSTPYHLHPTDSRLYSTLRYHDDHMGDEYPFDPTSTPSRGLEFTNVPITPRRPSIWAMPSALPRTPQFPSQAHSSSSHSLAYSLMTLDDSGGPLTSPWPSDDSSPRKIPKVGEPSYPYHSSRRLLDSPLATRSGRSFLPGAEESPIARYIHRSKVKDPGERVSESRPDHGQG